jgi:hypothetical protein
VNTPELLERMRAAGRPQRVKTKGTPAVAQGLAFAMTDLQKVNGDG